MNLTPHSAAVTPHCSHIIIIIIMIIIDQRVRPVSQPVLFSVTVLLVLSTAGCEPPEPPAVDEAEAAEIVMCDLMPIAAVAEAVGADPRAIRAEEREGICHFVWDDGEAQIGPLALAPSVEEAAEYFDENFGRRIDGDDAGSSTPALESVHDVGDRAVYMSAVDFTEDELFGRIAAVGSMMWVLYRNVVVQVGANLWQVHDPEALRAGPSADELARNREVTVTLGRRLVSYLARQ